MDIHDVFINGGVWINNPNYSKNKKNKEPRKILAPASSQNTGGIYDFYLNSNQGIGTIFTNDNAAKRAKELQKYGLTLNTDNDKAIELQLSEAQSNWNKAWHALTQTIVNEGVLGITRGFADLADFTIGSAFRAVTGEENDYTNPVSELIKGWQKQFEEYQPIYRDTSLNMMNGGLTDAGWWLGNFPSIASSIALFIPSNLAVRGATSLGKISGISRGIGNTRRFITAIDKVDKAVDAGKDVSTFGELSKWINNENTIKTFNRTFENALNAFGSRVMENYQESDQVFQDVLQQAYYGDETIGIKGLKDMTDDEYNACINRNKDKLEGVDTNDRLAVAKRIAKLSADRTFNIDMFNGINDFFQIGLLRNSKSFFNGRMSASLRRNQLNRIKYAKELLNGEDINKILTNRTRLTKLGEAASDILLGSGLTIAGSLDEGVEEAVNFIAQQEGMRYGHVLLGSDASNTPFDARLKEYMFNPQLYDAAFWGIFGGIAFQQGGSAYNRVMNAREVNKNKTNDKTKEETAKTPWSEALELPEIKARKKVMDDELITLKNTQSALNQIRRGINPFEQNSDGSNKKINNSDEQEVLRKRVENKFITDVLMNSIFAGNFNLTKAFIESTEANEALVQNAIKDLEDSKGRAATEEEKNKIREDYRELVEKEKEIADKIDRLYSKNLRIVGNALRGTDKTTGIDYSDTPIEYYQIIAAENMRYQLEADTFDEIIKQYEPAEKSLEADVETELARNHIDYKTAVKAYILAQQLGQIDAELDAAKQRVKDGKSENAYDLRTIAGQSAVRELELRKKAIENIILNYYPYANEDKSNTYKDKINKGMLLITSLRAAAATEVIPSLDGKTHGYKMNTESNKYRKLDSAILSSYNMEEEDWSAAMPLLAEIHPELTKYTREEFRDVAHMSDVFAEQLYTALGSEGAIESLKKVSGKLLEVYSKLGMYELEKEVARQHIATTRDEVRLLAHNKHNAVLSTRGIAVETALHSIKEIYKRYNQEYGDLSKELAYGTLNEAARNKLKNILTQDDMDTYDDAMEILALNRRQVTGKKDKKTNYNNAANSLLPGFIENALYYAALDEFEDVREEPSIETNETEENKTEEKNIISEKPQNESKISKITKPIRQAAKRLTTKKEQEKIDFYTTASGVSRIKPIASISVNSDNAPIKLNKFSGSHHDYTDVTLIPIEGEENSYELDFRSEIANNAKERSLDVFNNPNFFAIHNNLADDGEIVDNPKVTVDNEGNIVPGSFIPGIIVNPNSEEGKDIIEGLPAYIPSTGGSTADVTDTGNETAINPKDVDDYVNNAIKDSNDKLNPDDINIYVGQDVIKYVEEKHRSAGVYDEEELYNRLKESYIPLVSEEILREVFEEAKELGRDFANDYKLDIKEFNDLLKFADLSSIKDKDLETDAASKHRKELNNLFDDIVKSYAERAYVDTYNGKKVISLENLIRYANDVAGNTLMGQILYDRFVKILNNNSDKYIVIEKITNSFNKSKILSNAEFTSDERKSQVTDVNGRTIDIKSILKYTSQDKEVLYDLLDSLNPEDEIECNRVGNRIDFSKDGITFGSIYIPDTKTPGKYKSATGGWVADIPIDSTDGTTSKLEQLFTKILLNEENDKDLTEVNNKLRELYYIPYMVKDKESEKIIVNPEYEEIAEDIFKLLDKAVPSFKECLTEDYGSPTKPVRHLMDVYNYMKVATDQKLKEANISREAYEAQIKNDRKESLNAWFNKLKDSYAAAITIAQAPNKVVKVDTIYQGGLIITPQSEAKPVNWVNPENDTERAVGTNYTGRVEVAVASMREPGIIYLTDGTRLNIPKMKLSSTFISLPRNYGQPALVHAFPQPIGASHFNNKMKAIQEDVLNEFDRLLTEWGFNPFITTDAIYDFIQDLCSAQYNIYNEPQNNALFKGLYVTRLTGGFEGIQIEYKQDNKRHYIHLFDKDARGNKGSVIKFDKEAATAFASEKNRKKVLSQFNDILNNVLKYNIEFDFVKGSRNLSGFARRDNRGRFIIELPNGKTHSFKSFKDFILDNGVVNVTTISKNGKSNFYNIGDYTKATDTPNITFKIVDNNSRPVGESNAISPAITTINKGDDIKNYIKEHGKEETSGQEIINRILDDTKLKVLKNSKLLKAISTGNIIFARGLKNVIAAHYPKSDTIGRTKIPEHAIVVSQAWIDMLNSEDRERHEEAFRHLIHESIHRQIDTLPTEEQKALFDEINTIFDEFVAANEKDKLTDTYKTFYFEDKPKYTKLEEFLVESITRPALIERLNNIAASGKEINKDKTRGDIRSNNLFRKILSVIAKLFGLNINKGSLLEKEYNLFSKLSLNFGEAGNNAEITEDTTDTTVSEEAKPVTNTSLRSRVIRMGRDESTISDKEIVTPSQIRDKIIPENRETFDSLIDKGAISIIC